MNTIREDVEQRKVLVSDGAWGTFLVNKGLQPGECPELWNLTHRASVFEAAASYVEAGADMIETNSFGGSLFKLAHYGQADRIVEINKAAAAISREAAGPDRHVIASVGPTGKLLMMGDVTEEELYESFRIQIAALEAGGADAVCIETMAAIDEACLAIRAAKEHTKMEVLCTFTFDSVGHDQYRTMMGVSPTEMAAAVLEAGADIIGANCGQGFKGMIGIVNELRGAAPLTPVLVHANAGLPVHTDEGDIFPETPEAMAERVPSLIEAGANIIGGCCGTTPDHIRAIAQAVATTLGT